MFAPSQKAQDEASGYDDYQARLGLMDRLPHIIEAYSFLSFRYRADTPL
jgi:hypothetical protein